MTLKPEFNDILISQSGRMAPFIEIFVAEPENVFQENLGIIVGIFEVTDQTEDSSYIVNYLISIIRKEYFSSPKRGAVESFEAALHKVNLALSKLAEHGNIGWIKHLNGACAVIEKNNLHFSQTGTAGIFLLRSNSLSNISEPEEESETQNPLKTFQDVISGRMEKNDKIILTTESIFNIFSLEEIKKSALKFSRPEFIQFLRTALVNELDQAAVLVVDIQEKEISPVVVPNIGKRKVNAFSQEAFLKGQAKHKAQNDIEKNELQNEERKQIIKEIKEEYEKTRGEFVDKKTGHIYLREDFSAPKEESAIGNAINFGGKIWNKKQEVFSFMKNGKSTKNKEAILEPSRIGNKQPQEEEIPQKITPTRKTSIAENVSFSQKIAPLLIAIIAFLFGVFLKTKIFLAKSAFFLWQKFLTPLGKKIRTIALEIFSKRTAVKEKILEMQERAKRRQEEIFSSSSPKPETRKDYLEKTASREEKRSWFQALSRDVSQNTERISIYKQEDPPQQINIEREEKTWPNFRKMLPDFSRIKDVFSEAGAKKKVVAFGIIILVFIVPYFIAKSWPLTSNKSPVKNEEAAQPITPPLEQDKNVIRVQNLDSVYQKDSSLGIMNTNGKLFAIGKNEIFSLSEQKSFPLPDNFNSPELAFEMEDLNLIFIMKGGKIISFSAVSGKSQDNNINFPASANITSAASYLTYAYILDSSANQIYRYPRAEGGFGEKSNWLKDATDLSQAQDLAVSENIFVASKGSLLKLSRGAKVDFPIQFTATPISFDKVFTKPDSQFIFVLDKTNSRILKLSLEGDILAQYYNSEISSAANFSVDEQGNLIYVASEGGVKSFGMNQ